MLNDPARMAKLMPGMESFDIEDDRNWSARIKVPLGLGALPLSFEFEKTEDREPEYARLTAKGKGVGAIVSMDTQFHLSEAGSGTAMKWEADVRIAGPVGSMGQRVLQPIVNQQVKNVLDALDRQVTEKAGGGAGVQDAGPPAPTDGQPDPAVDAGSSGADEGISPLAEEGYSDEPQGPTSSTGGDDR